MIWGNETGMDERFYIHLLPFRTIANVKRNKYICSDNTNIKLYTHHQFNEADINLNFYFREVFKTSATLKDTMAMIWTFK